MPPNIQLSFHGDWTRRWPECLPLSISKISIPFQLEDSDPGWWDPTHPLFISPLPLPRSSLPGAPWSPMQIGKYKPAFLGSHLNSKVKTASSQALLLGSIFQEKQCNAGASSASGLLGAGTAIFKVHVGAKASRLRRFSPTSQLCFSLSLASWLDF